MDFDFSKMTDEELIALQKAVNAARKEREAVTKGMLDRTVELRAYYSGTPSEDPNCESWYRDPIDTICGQIHRSILILCDYATGNYTIKNTKKTARVERSCMYVQKNINDYVKLYNSLFDTAFEEILKKGDDK